MDVVDQIHAQAGAKNRGGGKSLVLRASLRTTNISCILPRAKTGSKTEPPYQSLADILQQVDHLGFA